MKSINFPQANTILAKDQPEYEPLHVHVDQDDPTGPVTACMELTDEEIAEIIATKRIWHTQLTFGDLYHPIRMSTKNPFE